MQAFATAWLPHCMQSVKMLVHALNAMNGMQKNPYHARVTSVYQRILITDKTWAQHARNACKGVTG